MKLLKLGLLAYGPFSDVHLAFNGAPGGFHLIYGPNEAGKSSTLRAISHLLFGIPERSPDNFRHAYNKLRIQGCLENDDGRTLDIIRRKGRRNTLRGADDVTVVDDDALNDMTGGMDFSLFKTMFGIDHEDLVRGGEEILKGEGRIGRVIFAAGAGISNLRSVEESLKAESDALFLPSGKKPQINHALSELKQINASVRQSQLSADEWQRLEQDLEKALARKKDVEDALDHLRRGINKRRRIRDALPLVSTRKNLRIDLKKYEKVPDLDADFVKRRRDLTARLTTARNHLQQSSENLEQIATELKELSVPEPILRHAETVETLFQELGGHRKAAKDRSRLQTRLQVLNGNARDALHRLRRDLNLQQVDQIRLDKSQIVGIWELGSQYIKLTTRQEKRHEELEEIAPRLTHLEAGAANLNPLPDILALSSLMDLISREGDLDAAYEKEKQKSDREAAEIHRRLSTQSLWNGSSEELPNLALPSRERIDRFESRFTQMENRLRTLEEAHEKAESALIENDRELARMEKHQAVPTEADLEACRQEREENWRIIRQWLERPDTATNEDPESPIPSVPELIPQYESRVKNADDMSDRMRREADRVALKATLLADKTANQAHLAQIKAQLETTGQERRRLREEWDALWAPLGIAPQTPVEMRSWKQEMTALAARTAALQEERTALDALHEKIQSCQTQLKTALNQLGEKTSGDTSSLALVINHARGFIKRIEKERLEREERTRKISELAGRQRSAAGRLENIRKDLELWRDQWAAAIAPLGLGPGATPDQATALLEEHRTLFDALKEAGILEKRIAGIDRDAAEYAAGVDQCMETVAPAMAGLPMETVVTGLNQQLQEARETRTRRLSLEKQARTEEQRKQKAEVQINEIRAQLDHMCREAGCTSHEALPEVEQQSQQRRDLESRLRATEEQLLQLAGGNSLDDFLLEIDREDPDTIEEKLQQHIEKESALGEKKSELDQRIGSTRAELSRMDGNEKAAQLAQDAQSITARIQNDVARYTQLRLSLMVLQKAVERYRDRHQGPILERSGALFQTITNNAFQGLRTEIDAAGEAAIMGFRPDAKEMIGVSAMSDGTADQLYLAIRLASLEAYLENHESMPLIVDDILIHFDDLRAAATLKVLAELSKKTQIIFFTHHQHLVELARANVAENMLVIHGIGGNGYE